MAALGRMLADDARSLSADGISDNDEHVITVARWRGVWEPELTPTVIDTSGRPGESGLWLTDDDR